MKGTVVGEHPVKYIQYHIIILSFSFRARKSKSVDTSAVVVNSITEGVFVVLKTTSTEINGECGAKLYYS